jgi:GNAT superfamily N-acetyltransferase
MPPFDHHQLSARRAQSSDLAALLALIADDVLGKNRDADAADPAYRAAFDRINADPNQYLLVVEHANQIIGMAQLSFIPGLSRKGATRVNIEAVRVVCALRGKGIGAWLMQTCIQIARAHGCTMAQLTSDSQRTAAHRFYARLGYTPSHVGFKKAIGANDA